MSRPILRLRRPHLSHLRRPVRRHDATDVLAFLRPRHLIIGPRSGYASDATTAPPARPWRRSTCTWRSMTGRNAYSIHKLDIEGGRRRRHGLAGDPPAAA
uniref:Uncharacterized protein n=1 Tax=Oryza sativa subsp. japonica TaxID=39947 RepID=Q8GRK4_ORYSJ|nr:hypothetical protein [Oryza sativa Japonica Group]BAC21522.1 hypothetical protein [Oryza sativa Japonica Group]